MSLVLLLASLWMFHPSGPPPLYRNHVAGWVLEIRPDRFRGQTDCRLFRGRLTYERQAVVFHLPVRLDTFDAAYRLDGGRVYLSRDDVADLAVQGFALHDDSLDNPSGGLVRIPADRLQAAKLVQIQVRPYARAFSFKVDGLEAALQAAHGLGCATIGAWPSLGS